ncbi:hypothetical protein [Streptomyces sp. NBC_00299]|uniref:hypothetical protein n=1 Tax=Streptomyces sp. NBC_00299 TaxID=2975705 RepID=UPI002E2B691F|nr:hypothetical protein [Streptomyces sp. NBC_00299]
MTRTLLHIDAAVCSHHAGDSGEACRRTVAALSALPDGYRTGLVRRRALDLYEAILIEHHHERAVRELRDVLTVSMAGREQQRWPASLTVRPEGCELPGRRALR